MELACAVASEPHYMHRSAGSMRPLRNGTAMTSPADHANTAVLVADLRHALSLLLDVPDNAETHEAALDGSAALDALLAQAETAEGMELAILTEVRRANAAEDERDQAREALREVFNEAGGKSGPKVRGIARAALAANKEVWTHEDRMVLGEGGC
jgi:hypothetical protein